MRVTHGDAEGQQARTNQIKSCIFYLMLLDLSKNEPSTWVASQQNPSSGRDLYMSIQF